jgi:quinoprotein glucose dehydrogenase
MRVTRMISLFGGAALTVFFVQSGRTQQPSSSQIGGDWPMYRHDHSGTGYSPLRQIDTRNVASLTEAWTYRMQGDAPPAAAAPGRGGAGGLNSEATPIVVNGVMYLPAANRVVALEPETG